MCRLIYALSLHLSPYACHCRTNDYSTESVSCIRSSVDSPIPVLPTRPHSTSGTVPSEVPHKSARQSSVVRPNPSTPHSIKDSRLSSFIYTDTLRDMFDDDLCSLRVDCFSLLTEDAWQPGFLIPQEVDPALYYPESTYAGPDAGFHADTVKLLCRDTYAPELRSGFFPDATSGPGSPSSLHAGDPTRSRNPLFQSFLFRERITSCAIFSQHAPPLFPSPLTDLLFFNFRSAQCFDREHRERLSHLALAMLRHAPTLSLRRNLASASPAIRTIRAFSSLFRSLNHHLREPGVIPAPDLYNKIASDLHHVLALDTERDALDSAASPRLLISIYLTSMDRSSTGTNSIVEPILALRGSSCTSHHTRCRQLLYPTPAGGADSITTCTTLTNCAHLLHRIDRHVQYNGERIPLETSVDLTQAQFQFASQDSSLATFGNSTSVHDGDTCVGTWHIELAHADRNRASPHHLFPRLILHTPSSNSRDSTHRDSVLEHALFHLTHTALMQKWPSLLTKLKCRFHVQYSHIFHPLASGWDLPSSEVCVPIRYAGQCIGCINIESRHTDRFNVTYIGLLSSFAAVIGVLAARELDIKLSTDMQSVLLRIHSQPFVRDGLNEFGLPSRHIIEDRYSLNALAGSLAQAAWAERCYFIATGSHPDDPTRFLATSDHLWNEHRKWILPRPDGINAWLAAQPEDTVGVIYDMRDSSSTVVLKASPSPYGTPRSIDTTAPDSLLPQPRSHDNSTASRIVIIRLSSFRNDTVPASRSRVHIILAYDQCAFELSVKSRREFERRLTFINYIYTLCMRCTGIADHWTSKLLSQLTIHENISHGDAFKAIEEAFACLSMPDSPTSDDLRNTARYLRYTWLTHKIGEFLSRSAGRDTLNTGACGFEHFTLCTLIDECIAISRHVSPAKCEEILMCDEEISAITCSNGHMADLLAYVVIQSLLNSHEHNSRNGATKSIVISISRIDNLLRFCIRDNGPGFPESSLWESPHYKSQLPVLVGGRTGRGLDLMMRACRHLNPGAAVPALRWGNHVAGGAFVEFEVHASLWNKES